MTYRRCIMSSGWLTWRWYLIRMSYGKFIMSSGWHTLPFMSSGWLTWDWFLIRISYGNVIMSSGWDTLPFLSHPDEIANFDFPQHAVALQRFRKTGHRKPRVVMMPTLSPLEAARRIWHHDDSRFTMSCMNAFLYALRDISIPSLTQYVLVLDVNKRYWKCVNEDTDSTWL